MKRFIFFFFTIALERYVMTRVIYILLSIFLISQLLSCSEDEVTKVRHTEGFIVGFDPCTINHQYRIGYVIISKDEQDTLVAYNLSDETFELPGSVLSNELDTVYKIPEEYFQNYRNSTYFHDSLRYKYAVNISYRMAKENEKIYFVCTADIIFLPLYPQVVIKSIAK